jgi:hypothetical protein
MTKEQQESMPTWRFDNTYAFLGSLFVLLITVGSFVVYLNRLSIVETKLDMSTKIENEILTEMKTWRVQYEARLGKVETEVAILKNQYPK